MSSHHIIRDEQEPPVVALKIQNNWSRLYELLGWSPKLIIDATYQEIFNVANIKYDDCERFLDKNQNIIHASLNKVFNRLLKKNITGIHIFCSYDSIKDIIAQSTSNIGKIPLSFYSEEFNSILTQKSSFRKWYPKHTKIRIEKIDGSATEEFITKKDGLITFADYEPPFLIHECVD